MNVLILGDGEEELAWAQWVVGRPDHRLDAAFPGFLDSAMAGIATARDLEDALARPGLDAVIVGGPLESRGEWLRRAAVEGFAIVALHPPGPDSEAYYQVALSREETGATIVPDLPLRLHPGIKILRQALSSGELGSFRGLRFEATSTAIGSSLVRVGFARAVDAIRAILGEIDALTATGDPPGEDPDLDLVVQLRSAGSLRAEIRIRSEPSADSRLVLQGSLGSLTLQIEAGPSRKARLLRRDGSHAHEPVDLPDWDPHEAILAVLASSTARVGAGELPGPNLLDGTRAMELSEAANRSLRRGRTVEMHYESISEEATFKSVMTSTGCLIFLASMAVLPLAMAGPPLGIAWTVYIPYLILPALVLFIVLQALRPTIRRPVRPSAETDGGERLVPGTSKRKGPDPEGFAGQPD
jgi:myo-inositol 2-dehydrogenase/D-chiro-inositol 1-dehydrogenase